MKRAARTRQTAQAGGRLPPPRPCCQKAGCGPHRLMASHPPLPAHAPAGARKCGKRKRVMLSRSNGGSWRNGQRQRLPAALPPQETGSQDVGVIESQNATGSRACIGLGGASRAWHFWAAALTRRSKQSTHAWPPSCVGRARRCSSCFRREEVTPVFLHRRPDRHLIRPHAAAACSAR